MSEIEKWSGLLALKMGGLMAVATTSLITIGNFEITAPVPIIQPPVVQTPVIQEVIDQTN